MPTTTSALGAIMGIFDPIINGEKNRIRGMLAICSPCRYLVDGLEIRRLIQTVSLQRSTCWYHCYLVASTWMSASLLPHTCKHKFFSPCCKTHWKKIYCIEIRTSILEKYTCFIEINARALTSKDHPQQASCHPHHQCK